MIPGFDHSNHGAGPTEDTLRFVLKGNAIKSIQQVAIGYQYRGGVAGPVCTASFDNFCVRCEPTHCSDRSVGQQLLMSYDGGGGHKCAVDFLLRCVNRCCI